LWVELVGYIILIVENYIMGKMKYRKNEIPGKMWRNPKNLKYRES